MTAILTPILLALGPLAVLMLMALVFAETGLLVGFFLPGDSLLFTAGVMISAHAIGLPVWAVIGAVAVAAIAGDQVAYHFGRRFGPRILARPDSRWRSPRHAERAQHLMDRHGAKTVVLARFVPGARALVPVLAGVGRMGRPRFIVYNVLGGVGWAALMITAGVWFGKVPLVAQHVELVALGLVALACIPTGAGLVRAHLLRRRQARLAARRTEVLVVLQ